MRCEGIRTSCRKCDFHQEGARVPTCPECGEDLQCKHEAVEGYKFCRNHGGPNPAHNYYGKGAGLTTGTTSAFPLTRLAAKYAEMQKDGRLLSTRMSINVVRDRIGQLLERVDSEEAPERMLNLVTLWQRFRKTEDGLKKASLVQQLDEEFEAAYHDYEGWKQIFEAMELDRKLVESEVKIAKDLKAIMTAEEGYELVAQIFAVIINIEDDPVKLKRYQYELTRIVGDGTVVETERSERETTIDL